MPTEDKSPQPGDGHHAPNRHRVVELAEKLRRLIDLSRVGRETFLETFCKEQKVQARTVETWIPEAGPAIPNVGPQNLRKLCAYFSGKLECTLLHIDIFYWPLEKFDAELSGLVAKKPTRVHAFHIPTPTYLDTLLPATVHYLCGTYKTYRYSFQNRRPLQIVREAMIVRPSGEQDTLDVVLFGYPAAPAPAAKKDGVPRAVRPERFSGRLCKFGKAVYLQTAYYNEHTHERRMRQLQFPLLENGRTVHYGLFVGYSPNLQEPAATRVIAIKYAPDDVRIEEVRQDIRRFDHDDPEIAGLVKLLDNKIQPKDAVLSVEKLVRGLEDLVEITDDDEDEDEDSTA